MQEDCSGHRALRRGRTSIAGQLYLVTTTTNLRRTLFASWELAHVASRTISSAAKGANVSLQCWVLMPDHWHALIALGEAYSLSQAINRIKSISAIAINRERGGSGRVWSKGFHDHALRRDEDAVAVARYVILNPLRAGIVQRVGDYPFWDAVWLDEADRSPASGLLRADPG